MQERVFVISDLHLGGAPGGDGQAGFQMCMPGSRRRLADFFTWVAAQRTQDRDVRLVLAGDIVDFLAEEDPRAEHGYRAFTQDDGQACVKLARIFKRTHEVWDALAAAVEGGVRLSLLLGNHDVELALPGPRRVLIERLGGRPLEFLHNGEALPLGPVLIEHGNRCDPWNLIDHDSLRELCSELSRKERPKGPLVTPGSELVVRVMNKLKDTYSFVDLLKPETGAVLPLLAVLEPRVFWEIASCADVLRLRAGNRVDADSKSLDRRKISAPDAREQANEDPDPLDGLDDDLALARELAGIEALGAERDGREIGARDVAFGLLDALRAAPTKAGRAPHIGRLLRALRRLNRDDLSFHVNYEDERYLRAARAAAGRGFKLVVFGHTHLVKRVKLDDAGARYLNTGTWADLMRLPEGLHAAEVSAHATVASFAADLEGNDVAKYREQHPTFAQIERGTGGQVHGEVSWFWEADRVERVPDGLLPRRGA